MSVFKRGKFWWYKFWWNGTLIQCSTKQGNKRVAGDIESARRIQLAKGEVGIEDVQLPPNFKRAMREFLEWSQSEHSAHPATYKRYITSSKALLDFFKDRNIAQITPALVESFKTWRMVQSAKRPGQSSRPKKGSTKPLKPATINRELACLKKMYNFHAKLHRRLHNPVSDVKFLDESKRSYRVISFQEQQKYLAVCSNRLRDVATILVETGMRPEEVYRMEGKTVDLENRFYFNPYGKTKAARRRIPLNTAAFEVVARRCAKYDNGSLFPSPRVEGESIKRLNNAHRGAIDRSGVTKFRLYDLRHTWATRAVQAGIDLFTVAAMLGHSKLEMVMQYAHPMEQHHVNSVRRLEEFSQSNTPVEIANAKLKLVK